MSPYGDKKWMDWVLDEWQEVYLVSKYLFTKYLWTTKGKKEQLYSVKIFQIPP